MLMRTLLSVVIAVGMSACASGPRLDRMSQEQLWQYALNAFENQDWDRATMAFERFGLAYPSSDRAVEARIWLARAYANDGQHLLAASEFERFTQRYPSHELADDAALGICESYVQLSPIPQRDQTYTQTGITACDNVVRSYPASEQVARATQLRDSLRAKLAEKDYLNGEFYQRRRLDDSAIIYYESVLQSYADTPVAPRALLRLIEVYTRIGYQEEAAGARERLLREYPDSAEAREVRSVNGTGGTPPQPAPGS